MRFWKKREDVVRIRRTAPRMWTGVNAYPCGREFAAMSIDRHHATWSPRDLVPSFRRRFAPEPDRFFWVAN